MSRWRAGRLSPELCSHQADFLERDLGRQGFFEWPQALQPKLTGRSLDHDAARGINPFLVEFKLTCFHHAGYQIDDAAHLAAANPGDLFKTAALGEKLAGFFRGMRVLWLRCFRPRAVAEAGKRREHGGPV